MRLVSEGAGAVTACHNRDCIAAPTCTVHGHAFCERHAILYVSRQSRSVLADWCRRQGVIWPPIAQLRKWSHDELVNEVLELSGVLRRAEVPT